MKLADYPVLVRAIVDWIAQDPHITRADVGAMPETRAIQVTLWYRYYQGVYQFAPHLEQAVPAYVSRVVTVALNSLRDRLVSREPAEVPPRPAPPPEVFPDLPDEPAAPGA